MSPMPRRDGGGRERGPPVALRTLHVPCDYGNRTRAWPLSLASRATTAMNLPL